MATIMGSEVARPVCILCRSQKHTCIMGHD